MAAEISTRHQPKYQPGTEICKIREAKALYADAFSIAELGIKPLTLAELQYRYGWLLFVHNDPAAEEKAQRALDLCSGSTRAEELIRAEALLLLGATKHVVLKGMDGVDDLAEAIRLVVDKRKSRRGRRILIAANHGLGKILSEVSASMMAQERAYKQLERAKGLMGRQPKSVAKMQVNWHMGKIAFNLGLTKQGERLIGKARNGLRDLGEFQEFTLASLDLGAMFLLFGDQPAYCALVSDTHSHIQKICSNSSLLSAVSTWRSRMPLDQEEVLRMRREVGDLELETAEPKHSAACGISSRKAR